MTKKLTNEEFNIRLRNVNKNVIQIDDYLNNHTKIRVKCFIDGCEWSSTPNNLLRGHGCPSCKKRSLSALYKMTDDEFKGRLLKISRTIVSIDEYRGYDEKIKLKCLVCDSYWKSTPHHVLSGHGCPKCSSRISGEKSRKNYDYFKSQVSILGDGEYLVIGEYITNKTQVKMLHLKCGQTWFVRPDSFLFSNSRCPRCKYSRGELSIIKFLDKNRVEYEFQYKIPNQRGKGRLSFDFYIPEHLLCIEYHGRQHYEPVDFFGGKSSFEGQKTRDKIKEKYCLDNKIELLKIPYWEFDNIEKILEQTLFT